MILLTWQLQDPFRYDKKFLLEYVCIKPRNFIISALWKPRLSLLQEDRTRDVLIKPQIGFCISENNTIYLGVTYAFKGILMVSFHDKMIVGSRLKILITGLRLFPSLGNTTCHNTCPQWFEIYRIERLQCCYNVRDWSGNFHYSDGPTGIRFRHNQCFYNILYYNYTVPCFRA